MKNCIKIVLAITLFICPIIFPKYSLGVDHKTFKSKKAKILCTPTKKIQVAPKPITYDPGYTDNDTTKDSGEFVNLYLNKIFIRGIIKDKECIPVPNTLIEIWQDDEYGKKRYNQFSYSFNDRYNLNKDQYSNFLGIATTTSDNNGNFSFISVMPNNKTKLKKQSLINISVFHEDFPEIENQIILNPNFPIKKSERKIIAFRNIDAEKIYNLPTYDFEVILDGTNKYKTY